MRLMVTGCAGFIGFHLALFRLLRGDTVIGVDNLNDYYAVSLKEDRLLKLQAFSNFHFVRMDISDAKALQTVFEVHQPQRVAHLAAQPGVRYSLENPNAYIQSNLVGFSTLLEQCRQFNVEHLVYASTSSVYGANAAQPYTEAQGVNHPLSLYAATKKANELMAHSYAHLFNLPMTGLRFFTVYGPWGRPDMAIFGFTKAILEGRPIKVYNNGHLARDFTYVDDIVEGVSRAIDTPASPDEKWSALNPDAASSSAPWRIYNIGRGEPVNLFDFIDAIERATGKKAIREYVPMQPGDVYSTHASTARLEADMGYRPGVSLDEGVGRFVAWYRDYYACQERVEVLS
ncbi:NAD-dependent epimerase [Legionella geestiana]|nr:NAD-dependent epimerase [Legionella geestiana]QBS13286.1 NAD-dependent epimerase [Legionella geestiana]QDQ40876.1 NAD-dependent epimerase [Legionella geestiana]